MKRALKHDESEEKKRQRKPSMGLPSTGPTPAMTPRPTSVDDAQAAFALPAAEKVMVDTEKNEVTVRRPWFGLRGSNATTEHEDVRPTIRDVNPIPTMVSIFRRPTNAIVLASSGQSRRPFFAVGPNADQAPGLIFAAQYTITYTASVTLAK